MSKVTQIERKLNITYRWWRVDGKAIPEAHVEELDDHAMEVIQRQMRDGTVGGQLIEDFEDIDYQGYWEVKREET